MHSLPGRAALAGLQSGAPVAGGPRLLTDVRLEVERQLPLPGVVEVAPGQIVNPDTVIATAANSPSRLHVVELAAAFDRLLSPDEVREAVLVEVGQVVQAEQALARVTRQAWFEREPLEARSPAPGVVEFISAGRAQIVIRSTSEVREERISIAVASELGLSPEDLPQYVTCRAGQAVSAGDMLARVTGFRPIGTEYRSPVSGVVESISAVTGMITIARESKPLMLRAYLSGVVGRILPGYGATVAAMGHRVLGVLGLGGKSWGPLVCVGSGGGPEPVLAGRAVDALAGMVAAVPGMVTAAELEACRKAGVRGVICGSAHARGLSDFLGRPLAAEIVTGPGTLGLGAGGGATGPGQPMADEPGFTLILTEGFGRLPMDRHTWDLLAANQGRIVSLDGLTQIRAGVVRPAVLIPVETGGAHAADFAGASPAASGIMLAAGDDARSGGLVVGQRVRLVRQPYFGLWGRVVQPPGGLLRLETEVEARVLTVELEDGRLVRVAEANVEV